MIFIQNRQKVSGYRSSYLFRINRPVTHIGLMSYSGSFSLAACVRKIHWPVDKKTGKSSTACYHFQLIIGQLYSGLFNEAPRFLFAAGLLDLLFQITDQLHIVRHSFRRILPDLRFIITREQSYERHTV